MASSTLSAYFQIGAEVEINDGDGSWYVGTVIRPPNSNNEVFVEYKTLTANDPGTKALREMLRSVLLRPGQPRLQKMIDVVQLRPSPPRESSQSFKFSQEVDAYDGSAWWEGEITDVLPDDRYSVFIPGKKEQLDFDNLELRSRREWIDGHWIQVPILPEIEMVEDVFKDGTHVEVKIDEVGYQGAWVPATVIKRMNSGKYFVECESFGNDDDTVDFRMIDSTHIRPTPPTALVDGRFRIFEEVDARYNNRWWVGIISQVLDGQMKYIVNFQRTGLKIEFWHCDLRRHQEWINGKWHISSWV